ncbi:MAG: hypothetical protein ACOH5I_01570 [Oligoflexus sp.]
MLDRRFMLFVLTFLIHACTTAKAPEVAEKKGADCFCGRPADNAKACAVWSAQPADGGEKTKVLQSIDAAECNLQVCNTKFQNVCQSIRLWPFPSIQAKWLPQELCYCDATWVEIDNKPQIACAAWSPNHPWLIEYYPLDECLPERCGQSPFHLTKRLCPNGFRAFYDPWGTPINPSSQEEQP